MNVVRLMNILRQVQGGGYPVVFRDPDGKTLVPVKVTQENSFEENVDKDSYLTIIHLKAIDHAAKK